MEYLYRDGKSRFIFKTEKRFSYEYFIYPSSSILVRFLLKQPPQQYIHVYFLPFNGNTHNVAEYYNTRYIAKDMREYVKAESRRIRLSGVRAKVTVLSTGTPGPLSCLKAFSWADITCVIKKVPRRYATLEKRSGIRSQRREYTRHNNHRQFQKRL